ncbi:putative inactive receptor-like protein kinase [Prunus yedoensis var. nudiflora]|uniref:Putative inactive receptor-like protein kinase n=1 Tax=Prunus yedoensis var. nudiflora TaxID=2094558 RepID=A0A314UFL6_PRUYE|nr:putative inactive receptor-like protein kinase [Prunus yedoensis var. nudiflora]
MEMRVFKAFKSLATRYKTRSKSNVAELPRTETFNFRDISVPVSEMNRRWRFDGLEEHRMGVVVVMVFLLLFHHLLSPCWSLNVEGLALLRFRERVVRDPYGALSKIWNKDGGEDDPCSWFGVECSDGKVVILNLKDLCLGGTLAPELGKLAYIKSM